MYLQTARAVIRRPCAYVCAPHHTQEARDGLARRAPPAFRYAGWRATRTPGTRSTRLLQRSNDLQGVLAGPFPLPRALRTGWHASAQADARPQAPQARFQPPAQRPAATPCVLLETCTSLSPLAPRFASASKLWHNDAVRHRPPPPTAPRPIASKRRTAS